MFIKKLFATTILILIIIINSYSQNSLSGKVADAKDGTALIGATIAITELKTGAVSDAKGNYTIKNLPAGSFVVQVNYLGYSTLSQKVSIKGNVAQNFSLTSSIVEMNEVVVTGVSTATQIKHEVTPMALISAKQLQLSITPNAIEAISKIPGVSTLSTGPNVSKPYIRGLGYNRVLTLFDGVRQEGQQWGDEHGIEVDQFLIDHIEVVKGPASLIYGSDALAGVVNLLPAAPVPDGTIKGSFLSNYQTNNKQIAASLALDGNANGFVWGFRGSHKQASDYQNKYDGRVYATKYNETDFNAYVGLHRSWGYSHLNFSVYNDLQEIPDGSRDSATGKFTKQITEQDTARQIVSDAELNSYAIATLHQHVQHYRIFSASNFVFGKSKLALNLGAQQSIRREFSHPTYPDLAGLYLILNTYTYDVKYYLPEMNGWETTLGVNGMYQNNDATKGTEFIIPSYHSLDAGPFALVKKSFAKVDFSVGARYDVRAFQNDSIFSKANPATGFDMVTTYNPDDPNVVKQFGYYKHTFSGASGSIGATYNVNDNFGIKANVARGFRAPNIFEISAKGVHPGTGIEQLGDANFKPEFSLQEGAGIFFSSSHVSGSFDVFNNIISNYIYDEKLLSVNGGDSLFTENGNEFPVFKFRQTKAQLYGGEFSLDIHPHPLDWLHFENMVSYIAGVNLGGNGAIISDSTKWLPLIPPFRWNSELRANIKKKIGFISQAFVKVGVDYYAAQNNFYAAYGTETATPGYTLLNAGIGGDIVNKKGSTLFSLNILGSNLTDVAYQSNMSRLKYFTSTTPSGFEIPGPTGHYGIYNMGRNFSLTLTVPLDFKK
ncbi:MAG TPA: TonB-dependent receptor [Chitinophagales bacterium]|nr:TonB-dependent receptor [Chitinophagales bacterium]